MIKKNVLGLLVNKNVTKYFQNERLVVEKSTLKKVFFFNNCVLYLGKNLSIFCYDQNQRKKIIATVNLHTESIS